MFSSPGALPLSLYEQWYAKLCPNRLPGHGKITKVQTLCGLRQRDGILGAFMGRLVNHFQWYEPNLLATLISNSLFKRPLGSEMELSSCGNIALGSGTLVNRLFWLLDSPDPALPLPQLFIWDFCSHYYTQHSSLLEDDKGLPRIHSPFSYLAFPLEKFLFH